MKEWNRIRKHQKASHECMHCFVKIFEVDTHLSCSIYIFVTVSVVSLRGTCQKHLEGGVVKLSPRGTGLLSCWVSVLWPDCEQEHWDHHLDCVGRRGWGQLSSIQGPGVKQTLLRVFWLCLVSRRGPTNYPKVSLFSAKCSQQLCPHTLVPVVVLRVK